LQHKGTSSAENQQMTVQKKSTLSSALLVDLDQDVLIVFFIPL